MPAAPMSRPASPQLDSQIDSMNGYSPRAQAGTAEIDAALLANSSNDVQLRSGWEDTAKVRGTWNKKGRMSTRTLSLMVCVAGLVGIGALVLMGKDGSSSPARAVPPQHPSPSSRSPGRPGGDHGDATNGGTVEDPSCVPIEGCGVKTVCYAATGEKQCATCAYGYYRLSEEGHNPRCLHTSVTLAQAGFPESAAGTYELHLAADSVPDDLVVGATVSIPTAVILTISREPTRPQPRVDVRFEVLGALHMVGIGGIVHQVDATGIFTAEDTAEEAPLFITRISSTLRTSSNDIDTGSLITPVVSDRSTGASFAFVRVAMPVNVTGDGKSVCSLLADEGDHFSFEGVSLTNITDGVRVGKMVLDGDPAHQLTLAMSVGNEVDLTTFTIPKDKILTVRGVDTEAAGLRPHETTGVPVRPKIEMAVTVSAGGVLRIEHLAAADAMTPHVAFGGTLHMEHITANYTLLQAILSPSGSGTFSFAQTAVYNRGVHAGTVDGGPDEFSLRLEPGVMLDMASLEVGFGRSFVVSGAKTGAKPRALLSTSVTQSIKIDTGSSLTLRDMEMPMCALSVSDQQLGELRFDSINLHDTMDDYTYRDSIPGHSNSRPSHTVNSRYMKCMHVDDWDTCHGWCNARGNIDTPIDSWWTTPYPSYQQSSYPSSASWSTQQFDDCIAGQACSGCQCNELKENQCWVTDCDMGSKEWLPEADCGALSYHVMVHGHNSDDVQPVMCSDGTTVCTARTSTNAGLYDSSSHVLRRDKCEKQTYRCQGSQCHDCRNCNQDTGTGRPGKFVQACPSANRTGQHPYCTQAWLAAMPRPERAVKAKEVNFPGDPDSITVNPTCPWTGDDAHLCTDHCLDYQWVEASDTATSIEPMCKNDPFAYAFWNMTQTDGAHTLDPFVSHAEYGTISGDLDSGYIVDFVYEGWTFPVIDLTVRPSAKTSLTGKDYTKTQLSITNELTVPRTATLTLRKLALVFPRLAPSFDNHSVTFLRVDGVLTLDAVAIPSSVFTTSVSLIFQDWQTGKIVFSDTRLYRETDYIIPPTCDMQQFPDHWKSVMPSDGSRQYVNASCHINYYGSRPDPTTCHCAPPVTVQITLATLSGDALSDAGLTFTLDVAPGTERRGVYNLHSDGTLAVDPPSFVPTGFGFFAPVRPETNYLSSLGRGTHPLQQGYGGCNITDRGRCVSQHYGFLDSSPRPTGGHRDNQGTGCAEDGCSLNTADRWDLIQNEWNYYGAYSSGSAAGHWNSTIQDSSSHKWRMKTRGEWGDTECRYTDNSAHTGCPAGCSNTHTYNGCTGTPIPPLDRWIPDLDPDGNFSYMQQWGCNISQARQCTMPADRLVCSEWECNATRFGDEQCALVRNTCGEQKLSPWLDCSRPRNQTGDGRQLNCTTATCSCSDCIDQYKPLHCMPHDPSCQHIGVAESTSCAKATVEWETTCSVMSPTGGAVMEMQNLEHFVNKSTENYTVHGIEATGGPWARNTTHAPTASRGDSDSVASLFEAGTCHEQCNPGAYVLTCNATGPEVCELKPGTSTSYEPTCTAAADKAACDQLSQTCVWAGFQPGDVQYYDTGSHRMQSHHCAAQGDRFCSSITSSPPGGSQTYSDNTVAHVCTESKDVLYADPHIPGVCQRSGSMDRLGAPCIYQYGSKQPAYRAQKGSNWSMWNQTLLANSIAISSSGAWDGEPRRFGPSLSGSPIGEELLPSDTKLQWDDRFGYNDGHVFRETPWKVCF